MPFPQMQDPLDPTDTELQEWAYSAKAGYPDEMEQDWDLLIVSVQRIPLFLSFVRDPNCPKHKFFLHCLYLAVGDCVIRGTIREQAAALLSAADLVSQDDSPALLKWAERTRQLVGDIERLIEEPKKFRYYKWCDGGYASESSSAE